MKRRWRIPLEVLLETERALQAGDHEIFAIWTSLLSRTDSEDVHIQRVLVPLQTAGATPAGVYVHIEGSELARIQFENYHRKERSVVQLHTHPSSDVRMSGLDREWEVVAHVGALSIIVPLYGRNGFRTFHGVHVYEREHTDWRLWTPAEVHNRLEVTR